MFISGRTPDAKIIGFSPLLGGSIPIMHPLLDALTFLILLRCGNVKLPPLCYRWTGLSMDELMDTHEVLCMSSDGDVAAAWTFYAIREVYDWASLGLAVPILKQMWYRFLRKNVPPPTAVLAAGARLNRRIASAVTAAFSDAYLSRPWFLQCSDAVDELHASVPSSSSSCTIEPRSLYNAIAQPVPVLDSPDLRAWQSTASVESSLEPLRKRQRNGSALDDATPNPASSSEKVFSRAAILENWWSHESAVRASAMQASGTEDPAASSLDESDVEEFPPVEGDESPHHLGARMSFLNAFTSQSSSERRLMMDEASEPSSVWAIPDDVQKFLEEEQEEISELVARSSVTSSRHTSLVVARTITICH